MGEDWFWHVLALALGGKSVQQWKRCITRREFNTWVAYFKRWPFDDLHRFHRPAALVTAATGGCEFDQAMHILQPIVSRLSAIDRNILKQFGIDPNG